jgi:hypothetical protein
MLIQGNLIGFGMFIIAGIIVVIGHFLLQLPDVFVMIGGGIALIVIDLIARLLKKNEQGWLMGKNFGGYLYFAPVWIFGIIVIAINLINFFVSKSRI